MFLIFLGFKELINMFDACKIKIYVKVVLLSQSIFTNRKNYSHIKYSCKKFKT